MESIDYGFVNPDGSITHADHTTILIGIEMVRATTIRHILSAMAQFSNRLRSGRGVTVTSIRRFGVFNVKVANPEFLHSNMRIYTILLFLIVSIGTADDQRGMSISIEPYFEQDFGEIFSREVTLEKSLPTSKNGESPTYLVLDRRMERSMKISAIFFSEEVRFAVEEMLRDQNKVSLKVHGYQTVVADGVPSLSRNYSGGELMLPAGPTWSLRICFVIIDFDRG